MAHLHPQMNQDMREQTSVDGGRGRTGAKGETVLS